MIKQYVLHSASEKGFWHNKLGWVYRASTATKFTPEEKELYCAPISKGNDAEYQPYSYDE